MFERAGKRGRFGKQKFRLKIGTRCKRWSVRIVRQVAVVRAVEDPVENKFCCSLRRPKGAFDRHPFLFKGKHRLANAIGLCCFPFDFAAMQDRNLLPNFTRQPSRKDLKFRRGSHCDSVLKFLNIDGSNFPSQRQHFTAVI